MLSVRGRGSFNGKFQLDAGAWGDDAVARWVRGGCEGGMRQPDMGGAVALWLRGSLEGGSNHYAKGDAVARWLRGGFEGGSRQGPGVEVGLEALRHTG